MIYFQMSNITISHTESVCAKPQLQTVIAIANALLCGVPVNLSSYPELVNEVLVYDSEHS